MSGTFKKSDTALLADCYICVLHFRPISWKYTPTYYPVRKYAVVFNGKCESDFLECVDEELKRRYNSKLPVPGTLPITIDVKSTELTLRYYNDTITFAYSFDKIVKYNVPAFDGMESWEIIISKSEIDHELWQPGYEKGFDNIYYNIEDLATFNKRNPFRA